MITITKKLYTKAVLSVLVAMLLALFSFAPATQAATSTSVEIQAQINILIAQITKLQAQLGIGSATSMACPYTWTRPLTIGSSGADVMRLQQFLNSSADTTITLSGAGSKGSETQFYGPLTAAAVTKLQNKYRTDILTPFGLSNGTGYFGPSTMAKVNKLCVTAPVITAPEPTKPTPTTPKPTRGDEANLEKFKTSSGDDTNLDEGQKDVQIMDVEFKVKDADVVINRMDVAFAYQFGTETKPWKTFKDVSLWVDGKKVASVAGDNRANWKEDEPYTGAYRLRFNGLDIKFNEDDEAMISVGVTLAQSIKGAKDGNSWDVFIPDNGIRVRDGSGLDQTLGDNDESVNIDINEAGSNDELSIKSSASDPEATALELQDNSKTNWQTVFAFDLDTDDSENDIAIRQLPVSLTVSSGTVNTFVSDVRLKVGSNTYNDVTIVDGDSNTMTFKFDRNEFVIDAGDRATVSLQVRFKSLAEKYEGVTIQGSADADNIEAEGADDLKDNQLSGAATGDVHTLQTKGAKIARNSNSATLKTNSTNDVTDDQGIFKVTFDVTAFQSDLYVNKTADNGTTLGTAGINYVILASDGSIVNDGTAYSSLTSTAKTDGNQYRVNEGKTESFTLTVSYDPLVQDFYRVQVYSINWASAKVDPTTQQRTLPANRYETDPLSI